MPLRSNIFTVLCVTLNAVYDAQTQMRKSVCQKYTLSIQLNYGFQDLKNSNNTAYLYIMDWSNQWVLWQHNDYSVLIQRNVSVANIYTALDMQSQLFKWIIKTRMLLMRRVLQWHECSPEYNNGVPQHGLHWLWHITSCSMI